MNYTRIYSKEKFIEDKLINLKKDSSKHLTQVLRKKKGSLIELFDGMGSSCIAEIASLKRNQIEVRVIEKNKFTKRQGVKVFLGQSLIKSEPFSLSIQKATELGVESISPIYSERTVVKVKKDSKNKRWESIAISSCQQCGEDWIPQINKVSSLDQWLKSVKTKQRIVLYPKAEIRFSTLKLQKEITIAIGPEGDFTNKEIDLMGKYNFLPVSLGKRILRADTAVISSLSAIRTMSGEF